MGRNMEGDEEQMRCEGTSSLSDEGVGFFWWGWFVTVLKVHGVHASAGWPKWGPKGAGSHANDGINRQRRFLRL